MYLKRLESVGFKSFAERIEVDFVPGVTAVVGPNGSGKSNITDAIRWVLGEQSARSLRGMKMEDIIFQGSDSRKALNVAEVTLTLDNTSQGLPLDFKEISITRRVYRSGESEFYINKEACRLKDIIDLFLDSGLGREAFSIISQGRVEEILSSKADERRTIFEEAAGVLKYKQRKRQAEYRLAETDENLSRIKDIVYEIESQMIPLEKQAQTAKRFKEKKKDLEEQEISLLITEIEGLHADWKNLLAQIDAEKLREIEWQTSNQKREAHLETKRQQLQQLDDQIEELQENLLLYTKELEQFQGQKALLQERTKHFSENKDKLKLELDSIQKEIQESKVQVETYDEKISEMKKTRVERQSELERYKQILRLDASEIMQEIERLKAVQIELLNKRAVANNEEQSIHERLRQMIRKTDENRDQHRLLQEELKQAEQVFVKSRKAYDEQRSRLQALQNHLKDEKHQLVLLRNSFEKIQTQLNENLRRVASLSSKKDLLDEMHKEFQGFFGGVKAVLKNAENGILESIHGAVIHLINIPKKHLVAIETVLGASAQHVVTSNEKSAREAIQLLKKRNLGRATFLPLDVIKGRTIPQQVIQAIEDHSGYIGVASDVLTCKAVYSSIVKHLMGQVILAHTLKDATEIAKLVNHKYRIVTKDGDVVYPGGSMSGGATKKNNSSLFTREKELKEIEEQLEKLSIETQSFKGKKERSQTSIIQMEKAINQTETVIMEEESTLEKQQQALTVHDQAFRLAHERVKMYQSESEQHETDEQDLIKRIQLLEGEQSSVEEEIEKLNETVQAKTLQVESLTEERSKAQTKIHEIEKGIVQVDERLNGLQEQNFNIDKRLTELLETEDLLKKQLNESLQVETIQTMYKELDEDLAEKENEKTKVTDAIQNSRETRLRLMKTIQDEERELQQEHRQLSSFVKKLQEEEIKANRLDVALENRLSLLQEEYTITYEKAKTAYGKCDDIEATRTVVGKLKLEINKLGPVNIGAIEEYERIHERHAFLTGQELDLNDAKATLHEAIAEMDEEMKKLFKETFMQIQSEFNIVFKELFGGGHAELKLTDPEDLLETGIEIIAQPPGKKLRSLSLLSGGERALTAIALLFAILRVRPVPFCVLDEVEAALDEANVARFAKFLHHYSNETQFIVITHRKGTMEEADVLYGVTMEESGVSRLVSVRLNDAEQLVNS